MLREFKYEYDMSITRTIPEGMIKTGLCQMTTPGMLIPCAF
jgi:hypothetical protein